MSAGAFIYHAAITFVWRLCGHDVGACAIARIGEPLLAQGIEALLIDVGALALIVGPFVPTESQPCEVVHQHVGIFLMRALRVDVFNAQQPCAALCLC